MNDLKPKRPESHRYCPKLFFFLGAVALGREEAEMLWLRSKMKKQSYFERRCSQTVEQLPARIRIEYFGRLHLDNDNVINHEIDSAACDLLSIVEDRNRNFPSNLMTTPGVTL